MNGLQSAASGLASCEHPDPAIERLSPAGEADRRAGVRSPLLIRRTAVLLILLFFATQFSTMTLSRFMRVPDESWVVVGPRLIVTFCGILFSLLNLHVQGRVGKADLRKRIWVAAGLAVAGAYFHAAVNILVFSILIGGGNSSPPELLASYGLLGLDWLWFYSALSIMILALTYASDLAESEERLATLARQAQAAQLKALRYQLNPHFLFNTLNSVAALINNKRSAEAEAMVEGLSDFLRSTLAMDAENEIPLGKEIELQSLYLEIEKARFPARLRVSIDVPDELHDVLVPNLIIQPLVENAIKYGVARSSARVTLAIDGREVEGRLSLEVWDDGGNADPPARTEGTGVGLRNVAERLALHFGSAATLTAGRREGGGFMARIVMPLARRR